MIDNKTGVVIIIKGYTKRRYFNSFGKKNRLCTAWSLAGAKMFLSEEREEFKAVVKKLQAKNLKYETIEVSTTNDSLKIEYKGHSFTPIIHHFYLLSWGKYDIDIRDLRWYRNEPKYNKTDKLNISLETRFYMVVGEVLKLIGDHDLEEVLKSCNEELNKVLEPIYFSDDLPF
ncbi:MULTISPECIES: hypothetical protein [unclassified Aureispira]|uniref:hypothetical protein n=1 Tax=unclassified Aureispira TaxID=2649989 RepID=UPI00069756B1|nr:MULTISPECIES: hypothetical protein [unclassified Aureispira]WMX15299.1 hypothetical protein QP953_02800 [Aureispira sp. CCB-E]